MGNTIMKKIVSIVLTTGLLMGTVAFGALVCNRKGNSPDQFQAQKKMEQHGRYQPPLEHRGPKDRVVVKVEVKKTGSGSRSNGKETGLGTGKGS
jgi:hypothetical protein